MSTSSRELLRQQQAHGISGYREAVNDMINDDFAGAIRPPDPDRRQRQTIQDHAQVAALCIDEYEAAGKRYAQLCHREAELEADRASQKQNAALRLIQMVNPLSGDAQKPYSATAAMDSATLDLEYRAHLQLQAETVLAKGAARTAMEAAKMRATLAIAQLKASAGVS